MPSKPATKRITRVTDRNQHVAYWQLEEYTIGSSTGTDQGEHHNKPEQSPAARQAEAPTMGWVQTVDRDLCKMGSGSSPFSRIMSNVNESRQKCFVPPKVCCLAGAKGTITPCQANRVRNWNNEYSLHRSEHNDCKKYPRLSSTPERCAWGTDRKIEEGRGLRPWKSLTVVLFKQFKHQRVNILADNPRPMFWAVWGLRDAPTPRGRVRVGLILHFEGLQARILQRVFQQHHVLEHWSSSACSCYWNMW